MDGTLDFDLTQLSPLLQTNPNNVTQTHPIFSKTLRKYPEIMRLSKEFHSIVFC